MYTSRKNSERTKTQKVDMTFSRKKPKDEYEILLSSEMRDELGIDINEIVTVYNSINRLQNAKAIVGNSEKDSYDERIGYMQPIHKKKNLGNVLLRNDLADHIGLPTSPLSYVNRLYRISIDKE